MQKWQKFSESDRRGIKLDTREAEIRSYLAKGMSKRSIAKLVDCSPSTLYDWLSRKHLHSRHDKLVEKS
ncbi:helix-turn-helix domain-containing protein [Nostoc flagelliforme]|uniref:helix-turn-helix domain-containing protein n=1 Tax=Nostoc flagelliforme TaxID=1306274 RepID=UPI00298E7824|nr:helix-turn-helix domain-containing protein [Nostoc flagelliforme]